MPASDIFTVTELTARIKQMLESGFAKVEVSGEVSRLSRPASGHLYFTIKDAHAAISAVCWRSTAMRLKQLPEEGGEFVFSGHLSVYEPRGSYQLVVNRIDPAGAGKLAAEFERRKQEYAGRGWFDSARKQSIPQLPKHIGIVTSPGAAAFEDVKKVLATRPGWLEMTLSPALVQGNSAAASITAAIGRLAALEARPEVILLVRGGGSIEDLWCFNDEAVVRAVVDCPIPVISGIGHEIDTTLADLAADVRAATPSNAAEIVCPSIAELKNSIPQLSTLQGLLAHRLGELRRETTACAQRQQHAWQRQSDNLHHRTAQLGSRLSLTAHNKLNSCRAPLRQLEKQLAPLQPARRLEQQRRIWSEKHHELFRGMQYSIQEQRSSAAESRRQLQMQSRWLLRLRQHFEILDGKLSELSPEKVFERGYSLNYAADGRLITRAAQLTAGERMAVQFRDGTAHTRVESVEKGVTS